MHVCRVCSNETGNVPFVARETMYGWKDEFPYFECGNCGCLQLAEIPDDLSRFYGNDYYSFAKRVESGILERTLKRARAKYWLTGRGLMGRVLSSATTVPDYLHWARAARAGFEDRILDVGCGSGSLLIQMRTCGFRKLAGLDPYVDEATAISSGLRILRTSLAAVEETFDFVMLHHSFEHMPDPVEALRHVYRVLAPKRMALIRIPLASSYAWNTYRTDWVQLDAPRHICLHTVRSMHILADKVGFKVARVDFDSTAFQFWGSEQCAQGIPLTGANSYSVNPAASPFTPRDIASFAHRAEKLNREEAGDQAAFYLEKQ